MASTITVSNELRRKLAELKLSLGYRSMEQLLTEILRDFEGKRLQRASELFRRRLKERGLTLEALARENERIRREIFKEWFAS